MKQIQVPAILWDGTNLREMIEFLGDDTYWKKWFKTFDEYDQYVKEHYNIFKMWNRDGSHTEIPVGTWLVHIPGGFAPVGEFNYVPANIDEYVQKKADKYTARFTNKSWDEMTPEEITYYNTIKGTYLNGYADGRKDEYRERKVGRKKDE